ncbi:zinc finger MYM-type protein 5-like [Hydra vulgaris]|uniref:Zinc finger MYM-type protein 5-like n=1 Tax=Hydra vulgaris TaxID=6087 RepID=A0ABM4DBK6_HYDVU
MNRTQKLSGAEFKKKRKQRQESDEKLQKCFKKWLVTNSVEKQVISEDICIEVNDNSTDSNQSQKEFCATDSEPTREDGNAQLSGPAEMDEDELHSEISEIAVASEENFQHRDSATWLKITDNTRCFLIEHGPEQDRREFFPNTPCDFDNRMQHFSSKWYENIHSNGVKFVRTWLQYSDKKDSLFCFC